MKATINRSQEKKEFNSITVNIENFGFRITVNIKNELVINKIDYDCVDNQIIIIPSVTNEIRIK